MADSEDLKNMVLSFRVSELQMLLGFAGRNKTGRKTELQSRALDLLKLRSSPVTMKIKELYKTIQHGMVSLHSLSSSSFSREMSQQQQQAAMQHSQQQVVPALAHHGHHSMQHHSNSVHQHHQQQQQQQQNLSRIAYPTYSSSQMDHSMQGRGSVYPPNQSVYHQYPPKTQMMPPVQYPIHPDVRFKKLPFYEHVTELLRPSTLLPQGPGRYQECSFIFHLTPQQATDVATSRSVSPISKIDFMVQMRFCLLETSCEQDDAFPPGICLKVNGKICPLPNPIPTNKAGVEPKRPSRPVNITPLVKLCPAMANQVSVSWAPEFNRNYATCINLVMKLSSSDLLQRLKSRGSRHADYTRGLIKEKLNEEADSEIATTSLKASLICPLGKMRMTTPCRASTCCHLQCFDASLYLQMNEKKPMWVCPVCDKPAYYESLVIDGYFQEVLVCTKLPSDCNEIQLHRDGSWSLSVVKKEPVVPCTTLKVEPQIETVSDESETPVLVEKEVKVQPEVVDLTLSDSDDGNDELEKGSGSNIPDSSSVEEVAAGHCSSNSSRLNSECRGGGSSNSQGGMIGSGRGGGGGGMNNSGGPSSVSSSGYVSPSVITLDSPSPPSTPNLQVPSLPSLPVVPNSSPAPYSSSVLPSQTSPSLSPSSSSSSSSSSPGFLRPWRNRNFNPNVILSSSSFSSSSSVCASPVPSPPIETITSYPVSSSSSAQTPIYTHNSLMQQPQSPFQPQHTMSQPSIPQQTMPQQTMSQQTMQQQTMPQQTMAQQTIPQQSMPQQSMPQQMMPQQTMSQQTMGQQSLTQQTMAQHLSPQPSMGVQQQPQQLTSPSPLQEQQNVILTPPFTDSSYMLPPFLDLDSDSNESHTNNLFPRY